MVRKNFSKKYKNSDNNINMNAEKEDEKID